MKTLALFPLLTLAVASTDKAPEPFANIRYELKEPIKVHIGGRRPVQGHVTDVSENQIRIESSEGIGEIAFVFEKDQIESFDIPGESYKSLALEWMEAERTDDARELMRLLFEQRKSLLPMLPPSESDFFVHYVRLILDSPKPARAIAIADRIRPQMENPKALRAVNDSILESYHRIALYDKASSLAKVWIKSAPPYGESALGYYILATDALRTGDYEAALDMALRPIVFTSSVPVGKLAHCYAAAIGATLKLRDPNHAVVLYREMRERKLSWPEEDALLKPFHKKILEHIQDA